MVRLLHLGVDHDLHTRMASPPHQLHLVFELVPRARIFHLLRSGCIRLDRLPLGAL